MIAAFPKIFPVGNKVVAHMMSHPFIEVTEKLDGSSFAFGKINGQFLMRSKGAMIFPEAAPDLFKPVVNWALTVQDKVPANWTIYGETLCRPRHNVLAYDRVPKNNFAIFGVIHGETGETLDWSELNTLSKVLGCEVVPLLYQGPITSKEQIVAFLDQVSILGGQKIEGVVLKVYEPFLIGGQVVPLTAAKFVSESFKEVHRGKAYGAGETKEKKVVLFEKYKTEARWNKAILHLREKGLIEDAPKDIGSLIAEVQRDTEEECKEEIKEALWALYRKELMNTITQGLPQWYKEKIMDDGFGKVA